MSTFQFKQFSVEQDRCAMKIGTDGVLLGAWTPIDNNPNAILDIGTGTGILRTNAIIRIRIIKSNINVINLDNELLSISR